MLQQKPDINLPVVRRINVKVLGYENIEARIISGLKATIQSGQTDWASDSAVTTVRRKRA
jgi:hypothetical protein